jgi:hypothetical protein
VQAGDRVLAFRFVGPPREDAVVVEIGSSRVAPLTGAAEEIPWVVLRFADGTQHQVATGHLLPGGPFYAVHLGQTEAWCSSVAEIEAAIDGYLEGGGELADVRVHFMPPDQTSGAGQALPVTDFYIQ